MSKPGADPSSGMSLGDALRLPKRHPAWKRREAQSGSCTERENLAGDLKRGNARGAKGVGHRRVNRRREEPDLQWKAAAFARWHEPDDARVSSPDACPVKAGMFSRRQTCRGNSQEPRSLDSRVAGNQDPEAYRQGLPLGRL